MPGEEAVVELELEGLSLAACRGIPSLPVDMVLVFDISTSAGVGPGSNWERTIALTQSLIDHLARPIYRDSVAAAESSRVALVSSRTGTHGPEPVLLQSLTDDYQLLRSQVSTLTPSGDTDIAAGLVEATKELAKAAADRAQAIVLMLHDNTALDESTRKAVDDVLAQGIDVYLVVNSSNIEPDKQITLDLASELVPRDMVYLDPDVDTLHGLFLQATDGDDTLAAAAIHVVEAVEPAGQVDLVQVRGPSGRIEGHRALWDVDVIEFGDRARLSYQFRLRPSATGNLNIQSTVVWLDCNGYPQQFTEQTEGPEALPSATPTSTPVPVVATPTPRPGVTPATPTATPTRSGVAPLPLPPGPPGGGARLTLPGILASLPGWLWWVLLALLLLALLLLLWWLLRRRRSASSSPPAPPPPPSRPGRRPPPTDGRPRRRPPGVDLTHGWVISQANDRSGNPVTVRTRPGPEQVRRDLQSAQSSKITVRVDEADREIGRAEVILEALRELDAVSGSYHERRRARVVALDVGQQARERDIDKIVLGQVERFVTQQGADEVYSTLETNSALSALQRQGYQFRRGPQGGREAFKALGR
jgi:hypothetical protein